MGGADIQVDGGNFTRVHNSILEILALSKFTQRELKCLLFLLRNTYGRQCKEKPIAMSEWCAGTDMDKRNLTRTLSRLVERNIIYKKGGNAGRGKKAIWGLNKYYEQWINVPEKVSTYTPFTNKEKVSIQTPIDEKKVSIQTPEKVSIQTPSKESKEKAAASHASDFPENVAVLIRQCYEAIGKTATNGNLNGANAQTANDLIEAYGWRTCIEGVARIGQRHQAGKEIRAPVSYLKTVLSDYEPVPAAQTDFSMEDIADV